MKSLISQKLCFLLLIITIMSFSLITKATAAGAVRNVPGKYSTIQAAINAASNGDTILIAEGTYSQKSINVTKSVTIASEYSVDGKESHIGATVIDGGRGTSGDYIFKTSEGIGPVTFSGLTIKGSRKSIIGNSEIHVDHSHFINASDQVSFEAEGRGSVKHCTFETPSDDGVDVDAKPDTKASIEIAHNSFVNCGDDGIEIRLYKRSSSAPLMPYYIRNNTFINAEEDGIQLIDEVSSRNESSRVFYISNNLIVSSGDAGIGCMPGMNTIENFGGAAGMKEPVYITNNTIIGGNYGITGGDNTVVLNCIIKDNSGTGVNKVNGQGIVDYTVFHNNGKLITNSIEGGTNFKNVDPQIDSKTYQLRSGSFCIDQGTARYTHKGTVVLDLSSSAYKGSAPDLGAFESGSTSSQKNQAPVVDAGTDKVIYHPTNKVSLNGSVTDDGLPNNSLSKAWSKESGSGSVTFSSKNSEASTATFSLMDIYSLKLTGNDGTLVSNDKVIVRYVKDGKGVTHTLKNDLFIEAENYSYLYGTANVISDSAAKGNKAIETVDGKGTHAFADYNIVTTQQNVDLYVWVRMKAPNSSGNSLNIEFNGSSTTTSTASVTADNKYSWKKMPTVFPTEAGNWRLRVKAKEDGVAWDQIAISTKADFVPDQNSTDPDPTSDPTPDPTPDPGTTQTIKAKVSTSADDAEESDSGSMTLSSSDLELVSDKSRGNQTVGMRFKGIDIPRKATIVNAYIQFKADETNTQAASLTLRGEATGSAAPFTASRKNITSRKLTSASVVWKPKSWTSVGEKGTSQRTSNIAAVIQEIVNQTGWSAGSSLVIIVKGNGKRTAEAYNGDKAGAPTLHIEFSTSGSQPPPQAPPTQTPPTVKITKPANGLTIDEGVSVSFSGSGNDPEDGNVTSKLVWSSNLDGTIGKGGSITTSSLAPGKHTITATVTDSDGLKGSEKITVTVKPKGTTANKLDVRIAASADDAEESDSGSMSLTSSDLELVSDKSRGNQTVGLRFKGIDIPKQATIVNAYIQFKADETNTQAASLTLRGEATGNAAPFTASRKNITSRKLTSASVVWKPKSWASVGEKGTSQRTSNIAAVIQEIVNQTGWSAGSSLVIIVKGNGKRTAEAYNGDKAGAPLLHIEFAASGTPPPVQPGQAPTAKAQEITLNENESADITLSGSDPDKDSLTFYVISEPKNGTLLGIPPKLTYTPKANYSGSDNFTFMVSDGTMDSKAATVTLTITPVKVTVPDNPKPKTGCFSDLFTDTEVWSTPGSPFPGYLKPFDDPIFGTKITRVTDPGRNIPNVNKTWESVARHHYSKDQAWNADQTLLMLDRGTSSGELYLDGETYEPLFIKDAPGINRWHPTDPELQIYVRKNRIGVWNVITNKNTVIAELSGYSDFRIGPSEGNVSNDGNRLVVVAMNPSGQKVAFAYDLKAKKKYPDLKLASRYNMLTISPLGNYIVGNGDHLHSTTGEDQTQVYDLNGNKVGSLWSEYGRPSHYDLTVDGNGDEVAVGVSKSNPDKGRVIKRRLTDGKVTVLTPGGWASHTSARNIRRPGWAYATYKRGTSNKWLPYSDEICAVKLDGSMTVQRLGHTHSERSGYLSEQHGSVSPDGTKVIFASNWDDPNRNIAAYVIEVCPE